MRINQYSRLGVMFIMLAFFAASVQAQYCTPTYFQGCTLSGQINNFTLNGASSTSISDLSTGCSTTGSFPPVTSYRDMHTTMSVTLAAGSTYTVTASTAALSTADIQFFIDFNNNNSFLDAGESVGGGTLSVLGTGTNFPITIPAGATVGSHRFRAVASGDLTYPSISPCPSYSLSGGGATLGEVHDYTVLITGTTTPCSAVTGLAASAVTPTSATISWVAVTGAIGYEWVVNTSATPPSSGTSTTSVSVSASPLTSAMTYYAHVRTNCGTSFSSWVTIPFTTPTATSCPAITGLAASAITSSSAIISWTAVTSGSLGYQYIVNSTSAMPTVSGTNTTTTAVTPTGLTAATIYYAHVRDSCGVGDFSGWTSVPFTTLAPTGVGEATAYSREVALAPNPVTDILHIKFGGATSTEAAVELTDLFGRVLQRVPVTGNGLNLDLGNLCSGMFLLRYFEAGYTTTLKVSKR